VTLDPRSSHIGDVSLHSGQDLAEPVHLEHLVECAGTRKPWVGALPVAITLAAPGAPEIWFADFDGEPFRGYAWPAD